MVAVIDPWLVSETCSQVKLPRARAIVAAGIAAGEEEEGEGKEEKLTHGWEGGWSDANLAASGSAKLLYAGIAAEESLRVSRLVLCIGLGTARISPRALQGARLAGKPIAGLRAAGHSDWCGTLAEQVALSEQHLVVPLVDL